MKEKHRRMKDFVDGIKVIDTHEHLMEESKRLAMNLDFGVLLDMYPLDSLVAAGLSPEDAAFVRKEGNDIHDKWRRIEPYWDFASTTDYCRAFMLSINKIYDITHLNKNTYETLTQYIRTRNKPGILRHLLCDVSGIERCIVNSMDDEAEFMRTTTDSDIFSHEIGFGILFATREFPLEAMQAKTGISIESLNDLLRALDWYIDSHASRAVAIKIQSAYFRSLDISLPTRKEAENSFSIFLESRAECMPEDVLPFQNYLFHHIVRRGIECNLPVRIHTGYLTGTGYMRLSGINPSLLTPLFRQYPEARFSLFHIGYPYWNEMLAIAKHYPNVWIDLCWAWIIDWEATWEFFKRFIHTTPCNKIFGFGGDYHHADQVYGHVELARVGISKALSELVYEGFLARKEAENIALRALRENAIEFFKL